MIGDAAIGHQMGTFISINQPTLDPYSTSNSTVRDLGIHHHPLLLSVNLIYSSRHLRYPTSPHNPSLSLDRHSLIHPLLSAYRLVFSTLHSLPISFNRPPSQNHPMSERYLDDILSRTGSTNIAVDHTPLIKCLEASGQRIWFGKQMLTLANPIPIITPSTPSTLRLTVRPVPPTLPLVLARWLHKQYHRPAGTIAKLAQLSKSTHHLITPILYSTIVLGGDHRHEILQLPHAPTLFATVGIPRMAAGQLMDGTYFDLDHWSNTIRKLDLLHTVSTIYVAGPIPEFLSLQLISKIHLNVFPKAKCIVLGPDAVESIGSKRLDGLESIHPDVPPIRIPPWAGNNPLIHSYNDKRPVWLSALIAITAPERLYVHFKQVAYPDWRPLEHGQYCTCCGFREMIEYLGPPHQWNSLKEFHAYGLVDHHPPFVMTCQNVFHFSSHLQNANLEQDTPSTSTHSSLVEVPPNPKSKENIVYPGPSWSDRLLELAKVPLSGRYLLSQPWGRAAHNSTWPPNFEAEAWNIAGHLESGTVPTDRSIDTLLDQYADAVQVLRERHRGHGLEIDDIPNGGRNVMVAMMYEKYVGRCACGQDHSPRLA
jgi:hypothetical protein